MATVPLLQCALGSHGNRLLSSLASNPSSSDRIIRKFVASSSKSISINTLGHILANDLPSFALSMYKSISDTTWYEWNPKLAGELVAVLEKNGKTVEAETLIAESIRDLDFRNLALFYCELIASYSKNGLEQRILDSYTQFNRIPNKSTSVRRRGYESMINGLSQLNLPIEAEKFLQEMQNSNLRPSAFEFRSVLHSYGRSGLFSDMMRVLESMQNLGFLLDTITSNIILSSYGVNDELSGMVLWLRKMKISDVPYSIRTYNSVLNSCPEITLLLQEFKVLPLSIDGLFQKLGDKAMNKTELLLVKELINSSVLSENLKWSTSEGKLDMHGMHESSAYLILLQWLEEIKERLCGDLVPPKEISIVCGSGKHSIVKGESRIKCLVSELLFRMQSPLRIDRRNNGRFVARGKAVKEWLYRENS